MLARATALVRLGWVQGRACRDRDATRQEFSAVNIAVIVSTWLPGARVVKAFNTIFASV